jgi:Predicted membrane protein (DUF2142)
VRHPLRLLVLLALAHGLLYAVLTPPWQSPDEIAHFEYSHLLARYDRPLSYADADPELERQIISSLYEFRAWDYIYKPAPTIVPDRLADAPFFGRSRTLDRFSLAYVPYALAVWPFLGQDVVTQLYVMRLVSVVIGALVVALTFRTAGLVEPGSTPLAIGAALFVLFLPQHTYMMASVSDGNLAELLASATLYLLVETLQFGLSWRRLALAALSTVAAIFTKSTADFLAPLAILVGLVLLLRWYRSARLRPGWMKHRPVLLAGLVLGVVLLPALWFALLRALAPQQVYILQTVVGNLRTQGGYPEYLLQIASSGSLWNSIWATFKSFWATFGWMVAPLPDRWYHLISVACALSGLGWGLRLWLRSPAGGSRSGYSFLGLAAILPIAVLLGLFVLSSIGLSSYQGRYVFGGIVPMALLLVRGWLSLAPAPRAGQVLVLIMFGLVLLDTSALLLVLVPFFGR